MLEVRTSPRAQLALGGSHARVRTALALGAPADLSKHGDAQILVPRFDAEGSNENAVSGTHEKSGLYLLHFDPRYAHAGHYLGFAHDVWRRMWEHRHVPSKQSPLVRAALDQGSTVVLARLWPGGDRKLERRLKRQGGLSRHCPFCRVRGVHHR